MSSRLARAVAVTLWLAACAKTDEVVPPLDEAGRAMLDPRRARAIDRDGLVRLLLGRGDPRGKIVADVGCGPGFFTEAIARSIGARGAIVLTDVRPDYLVHARHRALSVIRDVRTVVPQPGHVELGAGSVDAVLMVQVDHLFGARREAMLVEAFAALRAGGRLLIAGAPRNRVPDAIVGALVRRGATVSRDRGELRVPLEVVLADR